MAERDHIARRDQNQVTTLLAVSSVDGLTPVNLWADPTTHALLVDSGTGDAVESVVAGTGINVDNTDPQNPVVSTTITQYTDEMAQDAVGGILTDSPEIDFTYDDGSPSITASLVSGSIDETKLDASVNASLDLADNSVQLTGNQTVAGEKTFSTSPLVPTPTTDLQASTKKYVDDTASTRGDFSSNTATSVDSEIVLFSGTAGKTGKRATGSGIAKLTSGVLSVVTAPTGTIVGTTDSQILTNKTIDAASNTLSNIGTASISDNAITENKIALGQQYAMVSTTQTTTSTTYTDLTTNGPSVTYAPTQAMTVLILFSANVQNSTNGNTSYVAPVISGATTLAALDGNAARMRASGTAAQMTVKITNWIYTTLNSGSNTIKLQYKVEGGTGTFEDRQIIVIPLG